MELDFLAWLRDHIPPHPCLKLGIGDDAALLTLGERHEIVVTTDMLADGVDFKVGETDPKRIGHKALGVNLSDLAAMAAEPLAAVIAISLPRSGALELARDIYSGLLPLAEKFNIAIAGGDTNVWDGPLVINITALGTVRERGPLLRSTAQPGDKILVTGKLGGSILGRHLDVEPRIAEALLLNEKYKLHAGMDISDGLALDLHRLCRASNVGATIDVANIPIASAAEEVAKKDGQTALEHALSDGEDFELLLTLSADEASTLQSENPVACGLAVIGEITADPQVLQRSAAGQLSALPPRGYLHG